MKPLRYRLDGWSIFFGLVTITIFVAFAAPAAFGLQNFNQWGGMYIDRWCHADFYSASPHLVTGALLLHEYQNAGESTTRWVYTTPMHNQATCLLWTRSRCGRTTKGGWTIAWASPSMNGNALAGVGNVCDLPGFEASSWFPHAP